MGIVDNIMRMQQVMAADRVLWEQVWRDCVNVALPTASHLYDYGGTGAVSRSAAADLTGFANAPKSIQRGRELYDSAAAWATDRLTAGMESLITPRAQKWHALALDDPFAPEPSDLEEEWLDTLRDYLFGARYDAKANFSLANQKALKNTTVLGTGVVYSEENLGRRGVDPIKVPFFYRSVPLIESYLSIDAFDDVDKVIRVVEMTARAAAAYFEATGGTVSAKLTEKAGDPAQAEKPVAIMHAVMPREEAGEFRDRRRDSPFASFWIEVDTKHLIRSSGYFSFPYSVTWWDQTDGSAYGQSPVMQMLADIKMLQVMNKSAAQAAQQAVKPPLATMAGVYRERPNLNSGAINPGYLDDSGRLKIQPIITSQNPTLAERVIEAKRASVQTGLYVTLFQILVDNPQMSATEALIRANEKGELLGPAGAKIEGGIARRIDREIDILSRKGAFDRESPLAPPPSIVGRNVGVKFTGPLARLRRVQELQGVDTVLAIAGDMAQYDPRVLDRIDADETLEIGREISGAPRKMFRTDDEVAARRDAAAQQLEQQAALGAVEQLAGAAGKAAPAIQLLGQSAIGNREW
jgi:hypothetical protein